MTKPKRCGSGTKEDPFYYVVDMEVVKALREGLWDEVMLQNVADALEVVLMSEPMTDEQKLSLLADWLDHQFPNDECPEVQTDLRRISGKIRQLREENEQLKQDLREARSEAALIAKASEKLREENERLKAACESTYKWQMRARELLEQLLLHIDPGLDLTVVKEARAFLGDNK